MGQEKKIELSYSQRIEHAINPVARHLFHLMEEKKSNLAVAADLEKQEEILALADLIGPHIAVFKTHVDVISDFTPDFLLKLKAIAEKHRFILFEDRKFADIGNTVRLQYASGLYHIADWAEITNAHIIAGEGTILGLKKVGLPLGRALLLVAEMSSKGNLITPAYTKTACDLAMSHADFVIGFIAQHRLTDDPALLTMTPGVSLEKKEDQLGQNYLSPEIAILERKSDLIIVGRSITEAKNPLFIAKQYQEAAFEAYRRRFY